MKFYFTLLLALVVTSIVCAQEWNIIQENNIERSGIRDFNPTNYIVASVNDDEVKSILWSAPHESGTIAKESPARLKMLMMDGSTESFGIVRYDMMEEGLQAHFPNMGTFKGVSLTNNRNRVRITYTVHGLRATISTPAGKSYVEHYQRGDKSTKILYNRSDYPNEEQFHCSVTEQKIDRSVRDSDDSRQGACEMNLFQLAVATTAEYSNFHISDAGIPDEEEVHSAVLVTIARVNEVYEIDFGVRLILIDNNQDVYYYNSATDPYTNGNGGTMLGENQDNLDDVIGNANYDIGHVFSTGGGGVAYLSSVCNNNLKAGGVTGQGSPIGDPFDIDYVAHEMGHQMGGNHTQNNNCNRNSGTAMEPGSASTIMGYAGICSPNVQNNSDDHFHAVNIDEIMNDASTFTCAEEVVNFGNTSPSVTVDGSSFNVPKSTPIILDATGSDIDGDPLTYCWEQMDNEVGTMPPQPTNLVGPAFRSNSPIESSIRFLPNLDAIKNGTTPTWEVLPSVTRNMDWRVTVRDFHDGPGDSDAGCTAEADVSIAVDGVSGPFIVTSHDTPQTWGVGEIVTVTWDVAGSDLTPVNCSNVDFYFSADGTFEDATLEGTYANNGSASITVPDAITTTGRYMIRGNNNIFFDINKADITVEEVDPTFNLVSNPASNDVCNTENSLTAVMTSSVLGYSTPITLTATGLPTGATASFSPNPVVPGSTSALTISNLNGQSGVFTVNITGTSGSIIKDTPLQLAVADDPVEPVLISPTDGNTDVPLYPELMWEADPTANSFTYELSTSPNGVGLIESGSINTNNVNITTELSAGVQYYWRVSVKNLCGESNFSNDYTFTTQDLKCTLYESTDLPVSISSSGTPTITSTLSILDRGDIVDVNIIDLEGTHTYISDLRFTLGSPANTEVLFFNRPCNAQNNFDINFDDEAPNANDSWPCPPTNGQTYVPDNPLTPFIDESIAGVWTLTVEDVFNQDGGSLDKWGIELCATNYCDLTVSSSLSTGLASITEALNCATNGETIYLTSDVASSTIDLEMDIILDKDLTITADIADNITLNFIDNASLQVNTGHSISLSGFSITSSSSNTTILNDGNLSLDNMTIGSTTQDQLTNLSNGTLSITGNCNIQE